MNFTLTLMNQGTGTGVITSTPSGINCGSCNASFPSGTVVTLTAAPSTGSAFSGWTGAGCSGTGSCVVTLNSDQTVTAAFVTVRVLTVTLGGDGAGTVTSTPAGINCTTGSTTGCSYGFPGTSGSVTLNVSPAANSEFAGWSLSCPFPATSCALPVGSTGASASIFFTAWRVRYPFPSSVSSMTLSGSTLVAVGGGGAAVTSPDGVAWTGRTAPATGANAVTTFNGTIYAVANGGGVHSSANGITWTSASAGTTADLNGIASGAGALVAVGKGGAIVTSTNGTTWAPATSTVAFDLLAVTYAASKFVAVGFGGTVLTSPNGQTWTAQTSTTTTILSAIAFGGGQFIAVGSAGLLLTSADAITWTSRTASAGDAGVTAVVGTLRGVAASGSLYVAVGDASNASTNNAIAFTSPDGVSWTARDLGLGESCLAATFLSGAFYAMGSSGSIFRSTDGTSWTVVLSPGGRGAPSPTGGMGGETTLNSIAFSGSTYVAVGDVGSIFSSSDGLTWTSRRATPNSPLGNAQRLSSVVYGAGLATPVFVAVGSDGFMWVILSSLDGVVWTQRASGSPGFLPGVAYAGPTKGFAAVGNTGNFGLVQTSPDGITWTNRSATGLSGFVNSVTYGNNQYVALSAPGTSNEAFSSPDAITWTQQSSATGGGNITFGNGVFVASGGGGTLTSSNAVTWTSNTVPHTVGGAIAFGNGKFLGSNLTTSVDGVTWTTPQKSPVGTLNFNGGFFNAAVFGPTGWVGVGARETFVSHPP